ncbi:MAG TPA: hypothetical protein VFN30_04460 [Chitinophagaceae bacterium]|nr:hypothetical protein [Chitinophagaceae bacterium]
MLIKKYLINLLMMIGTFFLCIDINAQVKKKSTQKAVEQKPVNESPPKLKPLWGNHPGGNMLVKDGINYADSALRVIDEQGNRYSVVSFKFIYRRKATITDDETGNVKNTWDIVATDIYNETSLSEVWRNNIKESLQRDEEWIIDFIIIKDKTGKKIITTPINIKFK